MLLLSLDVCPSVRSSHAGIVSKQLNVIKLFTPLTSHTILFFSVPNLMAIFQRGHPNAGRMQGYEKNHDFRPISRFISKTIQDSAIVTM